MAHQYLPDHSKRMMRCSRVALMVQQKRRYPGVARSLQGLVAKHRNRVGGRGLADCQIRGLQTISVWSFVSALLGKPQSGRSRRRTCFSRSCSRAFWRIAVLSSVSLRLPPMRVPAKPGLPRFVDGFLLRSGPPRARPTCVMMTCLGAVLTVSGNRSCDYVVLDVFQHIKMIYNQNAKHIRNRMPPPVEFEKWENIQPEGGPKLGLINEERAL